MNTRFQFIKFSLILGLGLCLTAITSIQAYDGLLNGTPYLKSSNLKDAESPYQMCLNEYAYRMEAGNWTDPKSKAKKEGILLIYNPTDRLVEFFKAEKKMRINKDDYKIYNLTVLNTSEHEDTYLGIKDGDQSATPRYIVYHFKPKNTMLVFYFYGMSAMGIDLMDANVGNFMCKPVQYSK